MIGKVYKISCKSDPSLVYVGSTTKSLRDRLRSHRKDCRKMQINMKLYQHVNNDWSNWKIELIEEVQYEDKKQLYEREGHYIKSISTLNHRIAGRDKKQWCEDNKESIQEYQKQWREDNKEYNKQWREDNDEYFKRYNEDNKESIQEYNKQYYEDNKESIQEYQKQWREDNKGYGKEYRQNNRAQINKYQRDVRKANNHYRNTLLKKCFNAFKNHRADYIEHAQDNV